MSKRVFLIAAVVVLGLLAPLGARAQSGSAYPFRDSSAARDCLAPRQVKCAAGAKAARDGSFALDVRLESPHGGRMPGEALASSRATFNIEDYAARTPSVTYRVTLALGRAEAVRETGRPDLTRATAAVDPDGNSGTFAASQLQMTLRDSVCRCIAGGRVDLIDTRQDQFTVDNIIVLDVTLDGAERESNVGGWVMVDVSVSAWTWLGSEGLIRGGTGSIAEWLNGKVTVERIA